MYLHGKLAETAVEEWIDFPALDSMLAKIDQEDKNTNIQVNGAWMSFHSYDANRDEDFLRYPCDIRLDGYRLIIQLASKPWTEEKKSDKEVKYLGCREYLIKGEDKHTQTTLSSIVLFFNRSSNDPRAGININSCEILDE